MEYKKSKCNIIYFYLIIIQHGHIRHKRQHGAHLYLPESYVIPGGEGNPHEWGSWGSPSECSRTCGGGVAYQTRECLNIGYKLYTYIIIYNVLIVNFKYIR